LSEVKITREGFKCLRCSYEWIPKGRSDSGKLPVSCPKCRSKYWNKPRVRRRKQEQDIELTKQLRKQGTSIRKIAKMVNPRNQAIRAEAREYFDGLKEQPKEDRGKGKLQKGKGKEKGKKGD
jgi:DNA-directed RNA polymerase subunit RPC12/RpoP